MHFTQKHAGKWVAIKKDKVVAISKDFKGLEKKVSTLKDVASIHYALVPKGMIAG